MSTYQSFEPTVEVSGRPMLGFIQGIGQQTIQPYLEKHKVTDINPTEWYPLQKWLDVLSDLAKERPGMQTVNFVSIGMKIAEVIQFPPGFEELPFEQKILGIADNYQRDHRQGDAGEQIGEIVEDHHIKLTVRTPYPDDVWYGVYYGACRRFCPPGVQYTVEYDKHELRLEQGGKATIVHILWGTSVG